MANDMHILFDVCIIPDEKFWNPVFVVSDDLQSDSAEDGYSLPDGDICSVADVQGFVNVRSFAKLFENQPVQKNALELATQNPKSVDSIKVWFLPSSS